MSHCVIPRSMRLKAKSIQAVFVTLVYHPTFSHKVMPGESCTNLSVYKHRIHKENRYTTQPGHFNSNN